MSAADPRAAMKSRMAWAAAAVGAGLMLVAGSAAAFQFRSVVIGNGATPPGGIGDGTRAMQATAGQPVVGVSAGATSALVHGFWARGGVLLLGVDDGPQLPAPLTLAFGAPHPNPTRAGTSFTIAIPAAGAVRLDVFDLQGRPVDHLVDGQLPAGVHSMRWSAAVAPGVYLARLTVDGRRVAERRIVVIH